MPQNRQRVTKARTVFTFDCDERLRDDFLEVCKLNDRSGAQVLRAAMKEYIRRNKVKY